MISDVKLSIPVSDVVDKLYNSLKMMVAGQDIDVSSVVGMALNLMQIVEQMTDIKGSDKKALVLHTLKKFVTDVVEDIETRVAIIQVITMALPAVIDTFISLDRGEVQVQLKKMGKNCSSLFSCCK